jgi:hypothetical protein
MRFWVVACSHLVDSQITKYLGIVFRKKRHIRLNRVFDAAPRILAVFALKLQGCSVKMRADEKRFSTMPDDGYVLLRPIFQKLICAPEYDFKDIQGHIFCP